MTKKHEKVKSVLFALKAMDGRKVNFTHQFGVGNAYELAIKRSGFVTINRGISKWNNKPITDRAVDDIVQDAQATAKKWNQSRAKDEMVIPIPPPPENDLKNIKTDILDYLVEVVNFQRKISEQLHQLIKSRF